MEPKHLLPPSKTPTHLSLSSARSIQFMPPHPTLELPVSHQRISTSPMPFEVFPYSVNFYGEKLLAHRSTPKLEDHPSSVVRGCWFYAIRKLRAHHAVMTESHLSCDITINSINFRLVTRRFSVSMPNPDYPDSGFRGFTQSLLKNARIMH
jgi:hypothetical protein